MRLMGSVVGDGRAVSDTQRAPVAEAEAFAWAEALLGVAWWNEALLGVVEWVESAVVTVSLAVSVVEGVSVVS